MNCVEVKLLKFRTWMNKKEKVFNRNVDSFSEATEEECTFASTSIAPRLEWTSKQKRYLKSDFAAVLNSANVPIRSTF